MIATLLSSLVLSQAAAQDAQPSAAQIVGKMLAYYNDAKSMTGTITMTQSMMNQSTIYDSILQFELPSKLYLKQTHRATGRTTLVTSDGRAFSYNLPKHLQNLGGKDERLLEAVQQGGRALKVRDIYRASVESLADRSVPLDIAIGHPEDLKFIRSQWSTVAYQGKDKIGEESVHVIGGRWREYGDAPPSGTYKLVINEKHELRRYILHEALGVPGQGVQEVVTVWEVKLAKDGKPDVNAFRVVR